MKSIIILLLFATAANAETFGLGEPDPQVRSISTTSQTFGLGIVRSSTVQMETICVIGPDGVKRCYSVPSKTVRTVTRSVSTPVQRMVAVDCPSCPSGVAYQMQTVGNYGTVTRSVRVQRWTPFRNMFQRVRAYRLGF